MQPPHIAAYMTIVSVRNNRSRPGLDGCGSMTSGQRKNVVTNIPGRTDKGMKKIPTFIDSEASSANVANIEAALTNALIRYLVFQSNRIRPQPSHEL